MICSLFIAHAASSKEKVQGSLVVEKCFSGIKLKYGRLKNTDRFLSKIKLYAPTNRNCMVAELSDLNAYALCEEQNGGSLASALKRRLIFSLPW